MSNEAPSRLDEIPTDWVKLDLAHDAGATLAQRETARNDLTLRYERAVRRYLGGCLRGEQNAESLVDEMVQDFSLRLLSGRMSGVKPGRPGSFRCYIKITLAHMIADHRRGQSRALAPLGEHDPAMPEPDFDAIWREELLNRAMAALAVQDEPRSALLKFALANDRLTSKQMAEQLSLGRDKPVSADWVRQHLHKARKKLADLVREEVRRSLAHPSEEELRDELAALGLSF
jgi:RNA polymerase sigma factor (sigma-70 family)